MAFSVSVNRLRVVHIISGLGHGGAETVLFRLVTTSTDDYEHIVISMGGEDVFGPRLRAAGISVYVLRMHGVIQVMKGVWRLHALLRRLRPDVVQTWMYHADLVGGLMARLAGVRAVSWGIRNSGADLAKSSRSSRFLAALCAPLSRLIPAVVVLCAENAMQRHRRWGYAADRMLVVPNGYDLSVWQPDAQARAEVRAQWGVDDSVAVVGSVARWNPLKDHSNLLAALAVLQHDGDVRTVLIGEGLDTGNADLMALLHQHGLTQRVMLLGRRDDVPRLIQGLDVHVLSSRAEGFPNVVAEAMAAKVLCVVTDVGDAAHIVDDAGWVVPPQNAHALAQGMDQALALLGTSQAAERVARGRQRVVDLFSLETMVSNWEAVWRRLATDYPRRPQRLSGASDNGSLTRARRLLFVVNNPAFFLSHRLPVAQAAQASGFDVHVATMDGPSVPTIREHGFVHHAFPLSRSGKNPLQEMRSIHALWRLCRQLRPDILHAVTIKPVLYAGIAARLARVPAYVAAISGLGYLFTREKGGVDVLKWTATRLYRLALGHPNSRVIFQNHADQKVLQDAGVVRPEQPVRIRGSGVDLEVFRYVPEPSEPVVALCVARLLKDKGVLEFVDAARLAQHAGSDIRWVLVGSPDPGNPASISEAIVREWHSDGVIEWLGERTDIALLYQQAHIAVLPSYREGLPKSLVEAAASGRAVVTSDVPGCRDAIEPGKSGLLVPPRDAVALATAVQDLANDASRRRAMGLAGRELAEQEFDIHKIVQKHLDVYESLTPADDTTSAHHPRS